MAVNSPLSIGVDVGGSFTDAVVSVADRTVRAKAATEPANIGNGVINACDLVARQLGLSLRELLARTVRFGLGTTAVTNTLTVKRGLKVGLLTTAGFESLALTARGDRHTVDGWAVLPWVPLEPPCIAGIPERMDRDGKVRLAMSDEDVRVAVRKLVEEEGIQALAISFLWSFLNPAHEQAAKAVVAATFPDLPVFCGAELQPVRREYERTMVAVMNAFCADALNGIEDLERRLQEGGLKAPLLLLQASGGTATVEEARRAPLRLAASGPAAGVVAAAELAATQNITEAVCGDMGGTSFDVAIVHGGKPVRVARGKIHGVSVAQSHVEVESVGSGGGSLGWIDVRGMLRVGPQSARSFPGPACYNHGGTEAAITDAMVVLGYLDPGKFLGGAMVLDVDPARAACARLGDKLGLDAYECAWAIRQTALADMTNAMRARISASGLDPAQLTGVTYGGSGSLFMVPLTQEIGVPRLLAPELASVLSAFGAGSADVRLEKARSISRLLPLDEQEVAATMAVLEADVIAQLGANGIGPEATSVLFEADMQFMRQMSELTVPLSRPFSQEKLAKDFTQAYCALYGENAVASGAEIELVTLRAVGIGHTVRVQLFSTTDRADTKIPAPLGTRRVRIQRSGPFDEVAVYDALSLKPGHGFSGPALIDAVDSTLWVPPGSRVDVDAYRTLSVVKE